MGFWTLFEVASMPVLQVIIISILGAFLASGYCNLLTPDARRDMNKIVFIVFTPSLMFASLAKTVTLEEIVSWWFMPINIGITFLLGGTLGWILVKILKPEPHHEGLVIATCSAGNLGNLLLIIVPAICNENNSPFGERSACSTVGLSYASFSMALGGFFIWTYTYHLIRSSAERYRALEESKESYPSIPNKDMDANMQTNLLIGETKDQGDDGLIQSTKPIETDTESQVIVSAEKLGQENATFWNKLSHSLHQIVEELMAPPTIAAIVGFIFGAIPWLKNLIIGDGAPLRVIQDSIKLLGDGTIPCITLILGGNLTQGLRSAKIKPLVIIGIIIVRYIISPVIGIGVVKLAGNLGFLPADPLFQYVLMVQFTLPPAMNIGTMTQLFDVGQEECSVLLLWTYLVAAIALTVWSTAFLYILS